MEKYVRIKVIGEGSFGKALLVRRKDDDRKCVIKQVGISKMSPKEREDSRKEVKFLSELKHPNIVTYLESFEGNGNLYIVMDYCEGGDLYQFIQKQRGLNMEESTVMDIFVQSCLAVKHIHDRKILHRDIKTQNIFLTRNNIVKLGDFGIARILKNTMELARTCIGTPYYLSPEIVENRPYNNKSDIWSLGCVLYELATLKHAFEAGNIKGLVMKIVRGSYPPIPNKYSYELRALVAHCFKRSPSDRPSITTLLKKPIIQQRISKFLSPEKLEEEFNHTVLHKQKFGDQVSNNNKVGVTKPPSAKPKPRFEKKDPSAIYGVSIAKKAPVDRSKMKMKKIIGKNQNIRNPVPAKNDLAARERRRKEIVSQEKQYEDYMKKLQNQRWEKQQKSLMNKAREAGWKNVLSSSQENSSLPEKKIQNENENNNKNVPSEEKPHIVDSNIQNPFNDLAPCNAARIDSAKVLNDPSKAKILDEFWQRKKEAAMNKAKVNQEYVSNPLGKNENLLLKFHEKEMAKHAGKYDPYSRPVSAVSHPVSVVSRPMVGAAKKKEEIDYLKQLENIRKQNFIERKALMNARNGGGHNYQRKQNDHQGDPRYDPEARRKKIVALKEQAEQRAIFLRKQLEKKKKGVELRLQKERDERIQKMDQNVAEVKDEAMLANYEWDAEEKERIQNAVIKPAVGIDTAMNQVVSSVPKLFRSCSENDLQNINPMFKANRKKWSKGTPKAPFEFAQMPMEITSSAMEATSNIEETNISKEELNNDISNRRHWKNDGKTQFVNMLHNVELAGTVEPTVREIQVTYTKQVLDNDNVAELSKGIEPTLESAQATYTKKNVSDKVKTNQTFQDDSDNTSAIGKTITIVKDKVETKQDELMPQVKVEEKDLSITSTTKVADALSEQISTSLILPNCDDRSSQIISNNDIPEVSHEDRKESFIDSIEMNEDELSLNDVIDKKEDNLFVEEIKLSDDQLNEDHNSDHHVTPKMTAWVDACEPKEDLTLKHLTLLNEEEEKEEGEGEKEEFFTPNRSFGLKTGSYDIEKKHLRTCSLPDLRVMNGSPEVIDDIAYGQIKRKNSLNKDHPSNEKLTEENSSNFRNDNAEMNNVNNNEINIPGEDNVGSDDVANDTDDSEDDVEDFDEGNIDVEESEDYESMLESMRGVLNSTAHSPTSTIKFCGNEDDQTEVKRTLVNNYLRDDEEWQSDESDEQENERKEPNAMKDEKESDDLFSRIEESRQALEEELGFDIFMKIYKHVQSIQDNEEEDALGLSTAEMSDLLGDKEYLYQKILYLVMADSAYCEGNDGQS